MKIDLKGRKEDEGILDDFRSVCACSPAGRVRLSIRLDNVRPLCAPLDAAYFCRNCYQNRPETFAPGMTVASFEKLSKHRAGRARAAASARNAASPPARQFHRYQRDDSHGEIGGCSSRSSVSCKIIARK